MRNTICRIRKLIYLLGFTLISQNAIATTTSTVDCESISGITVTTWMILPAGDLNIPIPTPYDLTGKQCLIADFDGDGLNDVLIQGQNAGDKSVIFHAESTNLYRNIAQTINDNEMNMKWSFADSILSAEDIDGDGKADIKVDSKNANGGTNALLFAGNAGLFTKVSQTWESWGEIDTSTMPVITGQTNGVASVGNNGEFTYSVPVQVPPGINGMQPALSLLYNSNGGNGMMGVGWNLTGLSAITRCASNKSTDNIKRGVKLDSNDRFCLDGQKLVLYSGAYGASNATYRTKLDSRSRITSFTDASISEGPSQFKVETINGVIMYYGRSSSGLASNGMAINGRLDLDTDFPNSKAAYSWLLYKTEDRFGNYIEYIYDKDSLSNEIYIRKILYTGNSQISPSRSISFAYEVRSDKSTSYVINTKISTTKRLSRVKTYVHDQLVKNYKIAYEQSVTTERSRVSKIQECSAINCLEPIDFTWLDANMQWSSGSSTDICKNGSGSYGRCNDSDNYKYIHYADVNGDGKSDLCYRSDFEGIICLPSKGNGWDTSTVARISPMHNGSKVHLCGGGSDSSIDGRCNDFDNYSSIRFIDLNGDGMADLVYRSDNHGIQRWISDGVGFTRQVDDKHTCKNGDRNELSGQCNDEDNSPYIHYPDIDGDGLADLCYRSDLDGIMCFIGTVSGWDYDKKIITNICGNNNGADYGVCNGGSNYTTIRFVDLNADGMSDLVYRSDENGIQRWISDGTSFTYQPDTDDICNDGGNSCNSSDNFDYIRYPDFNADGMADLCYRSDLDGIICYPGKASGWNTSDKITIDVCSEGKGGCNSSNNYATIQFVDFNGDGLSDLFYRGDSGMQRWISHSTYFEHQVDSKIICADAQTVGDPCNGDANYKYITYADVDGNGYVDLIYRGDKGIAYISPYGKKGDYLTHVTKDIGENVVVDYAALTDDSAWTSSLNSGDLLYTKGSNVSLNGFPYRNINTSYYVVARIQNKINNNTILNSITYKYYGAAVHRDYGFLGFEKVVASDYANKNRITTTYKQDYPFIGVNSFTEKQALFDNGTNFDVKKIETVQNAWTSVVHPTKSSVFAVYNNSTIIQKYEKNEDWNSDVVVFGETYGVLEYDYISGIPKKTTKNYSYATHANTETTLQISNDESSWHLGEVTRSDVINSYDRSHITSTSYQYDPLTGVLEIETSEPDSANAWLRTDYSYDTFGNLEAITTSGADTVISASNVRPFATRTVKNKYSDDGYFLEKILLPQVNGITQTENKTYDARFGLVNSHIGPNGIETRWEFDLFGNKLVEYRADGSQTSFEKGKCTKSGSGCESNTEQYFFTRVSSTGSASVSTYYDKIGRELRQATRAFNGALIFSDKRYNSRGQLLGKSKPYFSTDASYWSCFSYDRYGRPEIEYEPYQVVFSAYACDSTASLEKRIEYLYKYSFVVTTNYNHKPDGTTVIYRQQKVLNSAGQTIKEIEVGSSWEYYDLDIYGNTYGGTSPISTIHYQYNSLGKLTETRKESGNQSLVTSVGYDVRGNKTSMSDPDKGDWYYKNDVTGKLLWQKDAEGNVTNNSYDLLGRLVQKTEPGEGGNGASIETTKWYYDTAKTGIGKLASVTNTARDFSRGYSYDSLGRLIQKTHQINGQTFVENKSYQSGLSRVQTITYPETINGERFKVYRVYNGYGYLTELRENNASGKLLWRVSSMNALGKVTAQSLGSNIQSTRYYEPSTAKLTGIFSGSHQEINYTYDTVGNVLTRNNGIFNTTESFTYDNNNRLNTAYVVDPLSGVGNSITYNYNRFGNITKKTDYGSSYLYGGNGAGPHAVTTVKNGHSTVATFSYDNNGNMINGANRNFIYTSFGKPRSIKLGSSGNNESQFSYDSANMRTFQTVTKDGEQHISYYVNARSDSGVHFEKDIHLSPNDLKTEYNHYLHAAGGLIGVYKRTYHETTSITENETNYFLTDALGSIEVVLSESDKRLIDVTECQP